MNLFPKSTGPYPYVWLLLWFPQFFFNVLQADGYAVKITGVVCGLILMFVFRQMYWAANWNLVLYFYMGIIAVSLVAMIIDPVMLFYSILPVLLLAYADKSNQLAAGLSGLVLAFIAVSWLHSGSLSFFFPSYIFFLLIIELTVAVAVFLYERTKKLHHQLNDANEQIIALTREQERSRFARDLHDTLGHTLTMIIMKSELASRFIEKDGQKAKKEIEEMEHIAREALRQTRDLVSGTRNRSLTEELNEAKRILIEKGIDVLMKFPDHWPLLPHQDETMIALVLREAVTNIVRHSAAAHCELNSHLSQQNLIIDITDDGKGIKDSAAAGSGLQTMQERMKLAGGTVVFIPKSKGTTVRLSLPLPPKRESEGA
jgi:two-component system sensor histidine kinase DesK